VAAVAVGVGLMQVAEPGKLAVSAVASSLAMAAVRRWPLPGVVLEAALLAMTGPASIAATRGSLVTLLVAPRAVAYRSARLATGTAVVVAYLALLVRAGTPFLLTPVAKAGTVAGMLVLLVVLAAVIAAPVVSGRYLRAVREAAVVAQQRAADAEARHA